MSQDFFKLSGSKILLNLRRIEQVDHRRFKVCFRFKYVVLFRNDGS